MDLTTGYLADQHSTVFAYCCSAMFAEDQTRGTNEGWHGELLSYWLRERLMNSGFDVSVPSPGTKGWKSNATYSSIKMTLYCENINFNETGHWKVSIRVVDDDLIEAKHLPMFRQFQNILASEPQIINVEWNRSILNREASIINHKCTSEMQAV